MKMITAPCAEKFHRAVKSMVFKSPCTGQCAVMLLSRSRSNKIKICWKVLAKQIGLSKSSAVSGLKRVLHTEVGRTKLAAWLHEYTQVAAAHAATVMATMEVERRRLERCVQELKCTCELTFDELLEQRQQNNQEEIAFNLQVTANQQQATEKERERNEAEQAELRRRQAEWN